jgi:Tir chaperone protein (CesT) family
MLQVERIEQLMKEVGPTADLYAVAACPSEGMWHIAVDEETEVFVEMASSRGVLVVTGRIGKPAAGDLNALYELVLRYAHVWEATDGLRISLDSTEGALWLLFDCAAHDISPADFGHLITGFASKLQAWREVAAMPARLQDEPQRLEALLGPGVVRG